MSLYRCVMIEKGNVQNCNKQEVQVILGNQVMSYKKHLKNIYIYTANALKKKKWVKYYLSLFVSRVHCCSKMGFKR